MFNRESWGAFEGEEHQQVLRELFASLTASGALKPQLCRWRLIPPIRGSEKSQSRNARGEAIGGRNVIPMVALARASYQCGCWIEWRDKRGRAAELPAPSLELDEFAFAERHLGSLVREHACVMHYDGKHTRTSEADGTKAGVTWWTAKRCERNGGHQGGIEDDFCGRCGGAL